jgi:hypothetical protein
MLRSIRRHHYSHSAVLLFKTWSRRAGQRGDAFGQSDVAFQPFDDVTRSGGIRLRSTPSPARRRSSLERCATPAIAGQRYADDFEVILLLAQYSEGSGNQAIGWHPSRVPAFECRPAHLAFKAGDLANRGHGLGPTVNRATWAGSIKGFDHDPTIAPRGKKGQSKIQLSGRSQSAVAAMDSKPNL